MTVALEDDIRIIALGKGFECFCDERCVRLVEQATVPMMGVDDRPLVGIFEFPITKPDEAGEVLPVACGFLRRFFDVQFAKLHRRVPLNG